MAFHCKQPEIICESKQDAKKPVNRSKIAVAAKGFLSPVHMLLQSLNHIISSQESG